MFLKTPAGGFFSLSLGDGPVSVNFADSFVNAFAPWNYPAMQCATQQKFHSRSKARYTTIQ